MEVAILAAQVCHRRYLTAIPGAYLVLFSSVLALILWSLLAEFSLIPGG
jgi:hypothetical protein